MRGGTNQHSFNAVNVETMNDYRVAIWAALNPLDSTRFNTQCLYAYALILLDLSSQTFQLLYEYFTCCH